VGPGRINPLCRDENSLLMNVFFFVFVYFFLPSLTLPFVEMIPMIPKTKKEWQSYVCWALCFCFSSSISIITAGVCVCFVRAIDDDDADV
jgi:hypothetical protein